MVYSERQIAKTRAANQVVGHCHALVAAAVAPGITTLELDEICEREIRAAGGEPAFKGYRIGNLPPFPGTICASPDDMIVHGIPDDKPLAEGTVLAVDIGCKLEGFYGDAAWTYAVGEVSEEAEQLLSAGEACLEAGLKAIKPAKYVVEIGRAITDVLENTGFSSVREYVGHGVGKNLHEKPQIPHFVPPLSDKSHRTLLRQGMTIAVEPMINAGTWRTRHKPGTWPVYTADGKLSVHFEHSLAILKNGVEILSLPAEDDIVETQAWRKMIRRWRRIQRELLGEEPGGE